MAFGQLAACVADSTLTTKGDLSPFVVNSTLTTNGELAPFVADSTLDGTTQLDLAAFVVDASLDGLTQLNLAPVVVSAALTVFGELALPALEPLPDGISATLPSITADLTAPFGNVDGATLPLLVAGIEVPFTNASIAASIGGVILTNGFDENDDPIVIETPGTISVLLSDGSVSATIAVTVPMPVIGIAVDQGQNIAAELTKISSSIEAGSNSTAEVAVTLPTPSVDIAGGQFEFNAAIPTITSFINTTDTAWASIGATAPLIDSDITGIAGASATVSAELPYVTVGMTGVPGQVATVDVALRPVSVSVNALLGTSATLDAALALITASVGSLQQVSATVTVSLPSFEFSASTYTPVAQVATYVTDTLTSAVSTYEAFPFNSFAEINGKYYGAGPTGMFELVGDKDTSSGAITNVDAVVATGHLHFGSEMQKRMSDFFIAMRADGDITLRVSVDENDPFEYTLSPLDIETLKQRRSLIGKGAKGKYWKFELSNTDGCDFDFDSFNAAAVVLSRRL